jgi:HK97 gp10 family phage protein
MSLNGVAGVLQALADIDKKVARKALKEAVKEAVKPVLKAARAKVPVDTRTLKKALGTKIKPYKNSLTVVGIVGPRKDKGGKDKSGKARVSKRKKLVRTSASGRQYFRDPVKYAHLLEFGTRPHSLGKGDRLKRKGKKRKGKATQTRGAPRHPGTQAQPFMRPALDQNKATCRRIIRSVLVAHLRKARRGK